ncbi:MAG: NfeD family protein [Saccharofermentanales bacterium]
MLFSAVPFACAVEIFSFIDQIEALQAAIFIAGLLLLIAEMFMPGFGVAGISGLVLIVVGILLTASTPFEALVMFIIFFLLAGIVLAIVIRSASKGRLNKKLVLHLSSQQELGYSSSKDLTDLIGKTGTAVTTLRPSGTGDFEGTRYDVVTEGSYIEKDTRIKVRQVNGSRIVVEAVEASSDGQPDKQI